MDMDIDAMGSQMTSEHGVDDVWSNSFLKIGADLDSGIVENIASINLGSVNFDGSCNDAVHEEPGISY